MPCHAIKQVSGHSQNVRGTALMSCDSSLGSRDSYLQIDVLQKYFLETESRSSCLHRHSPIWWFDGTVDRCKPGVESSSPNRTAKDWVSWVCYLGCIQTSPQWKVSFEDWYWLRPWTIKQIVPCNRIRYWKLLHNMYWSDSGLIPLAHQRCP